MAWQCIVEGKELADERADRRSAESIEKYKVSRNAVFFEGQYLPSSVITSMRTQPSTYTPRGCCGRGVPVFKLRLDYGAEKPLILIVEHEKNARRMTEILCAGNPGILVEEYVDPHSGERSIAP